MTPRPAPCKGANAITTGANGHMHAMGAVLCVLCVRGVRGVRGVAREAREAERRARIAGVLARAMGDERGAAVLEFALAAPLFLALIMAILQLALVYLGQAGLDGAAAASARLLESGRPQQEGWDAGVFAKAACGSLPPFMSCDRLTVDVVSVPRLADAASLPAMGGAYAPGGPDALVVLRLRYVWPTGATPLGLNLADQPGGNRDLLATRLLRTEPYAAVNS